MLVGFYDINLFLHTYTRTHARVWAVFPLIFAGGHFSHANTSLVINTTLSDHRQQQQYQSRRWRWSRWLSPTFPVKLHRCFALLECLFALLLFLKAARLHHFGTELWGRWLLQEFSQPLHCVKRVLCGTRCGNIRHRTLWVSVAQLKINKQRLRMFLFCQSMFYFLSVHSKVIIYIYIYI